METTEVKDPLTGEVFVPKRTNQKFANRKNQVSFNNGKQKLNRHSKLFIDKLLDANRKILCNLLAGNNEFVISKDELFRAGYNFTYFTHTLKENNTKAFGLYEFGIMPTENNNFKIFKHV